MTQLGDTYSNVFPGMKKNHIYFKRETENLGDKLDLVKEVMPVEGMRAVS